MLGPILGHLMKRVLPTSPAGYATPAEFLLRPRTATIVGMAFLFSLWSPGPAIGKPTEALRAYAQSRRKEVYG